MPQPPPQTCASAKRSSWPKSTPRPGLGVPRRRSPLERVCSVYTAGGRPGSLRRTCHSAQAHSISLRPAGQFTVLSCFKAAGSRCKVCGWAHREAGLGLGGHRWCRPRSPAHSNPYSSPQAKARTHINAVLSAPGLLVCLILSACLSNNLVLVRISAC